MTVNIALFLFLCKKCSAKGPGTLILWPPDVKNWLIGKNHDAGKDWRQEKWTTEDEMAGWHHWLDGHESEWTPGVGDGQGGLECCSSWGRKESDTTEKLNWTELLLRVKAGSLGKYLWIIMRKEHLHTKVFCFVVWNLHQCLTDDYIGSQSLEHIFAFISCSWQLWELGNVEGGWMKPREAEQLSPSTVHSQSHSFLNATC